MLNRKFKVYGKIQRIGCIFVRVSLFTFLLLSDNQGQEISLVTNPFAGYEGYWYVEKNETSQYVGEEVLSFINDKFSPCRFSGTLCLRSQRIYSNPGPKKRDTGRIVCAERLDVPSCDQRMASLKYDQVRYLDSSEIQNLPTQDVLSKLAFFIYSDILTHRTMLNVSQ